MDGMQPQTGLGPVSLFISFLFLFYISYRRWIHIHGIAVVKVNHNIFRDDSCYILLLAIFVFHARDLFYLLLTAIAK